MYKSKHFRKNELINVIVYSEKVVCHWWGGQLDPEISEEWKWIKNEKLKKPFFEY